MVFLKVISSDINKTKTSNIIRRVNICRNKIEIEQFHIEIVLDSKNSYLNINIEFQNRRNRI